MGKKQMSPEKYALAIAGCKESRRIGMCERECAHWHPVSRVNPLFCKSAAGVFANNSKKHVCK